MVGFAEVGSRVILGGGKASPRGLTGLGDVCAHVGTDKGSCGRKERPTGTCQLPQALMMLFSFHFPFPAPWNSPEDVGILTSRPRPVVLKLWGHQNLLGSLFKMSFPGPSYPQILIKWAEGVVQKSNNGFCPVFNIQFLEHLQEEKWNVPCSVQGPGLATGKLVAAAAAEWGK